MNTQQIYNKFKKGLLTESQFIQQIRNNPSLKQWISQFTSPQDAIKILKNKQIINESVTFGDDDEWEDEFNINPKYGKNPGAEAFNNLEKGEGDWEDQNVLDYYTGIGKNARIGSKDAFSLNEEDLDENTVHSMQQVSNVLQSKGYNEEDIVDSIIKLRQGDEFEKRKLEKEIPNISQYINQLYGVSKTNKLNELEIIKPFNKKQLLNNIDEFVNTMSLDNYQREDDDDYEEATPESEFFFDQYPQWKNIITGTYIDHLIQEKTHNLNELEHIQWNSISEKDAKNLKDYYDRTGRLPYGLTPQQYQEIVKKHNLNNKSINERKNPIKGGKGDKLTIDKVNPTELFMGIKVEMEHTKDRNKALDIVMDHLKEDPVYYTKLKMAGLADELKKDKKLKNNDLVKSNKSNNVDKNNALKPIKGIKKIKQSAKNSTKETIKPVKGVQTMTQVPKKAKGITKTMEVPKQKSKEIQLKETIDKIVAQVIKECQCEQQLKENNTLKVGDRVKINHPEKHNGVIKVINGDRAVVLGDNKQTWNISLNQLTKIKKNIFDLNQNNPRAGGDMMNMIKEEKVSNFKVGQEFTMTDDLGKFKKGESVTVIKILPFGNDIELHLKGKEAKDVFYLDRNDNL